jgi:CrcB protein
MTQLLVATAGALGTLLRYEIGVLLLSRLGTGFPYGTLAVNVIGSCALGVVAEGLSGQTVAGVDLRLVLGTGVLGGFTTYSAFNLELFRMIEQHALGRAALYLALTLLGCLLSAGAGVVLVRALSNR